MERFERTHNPYVLGQRLRGGISAATGTHPAQHGYAARTAQLLAGLAGGLRPLADHRVPGLVQSQSRFRSLAFVATGLSLWAFGTRPRSRRGPLRVRLAFGPNDVYQFDQFAGHGHLGLVFVVASAAGQSGVQPPQSPRLEALGG